MSSSSFNATLDLALKPSLRAVQAMLVLHLVAITLAFLAAPPKGMGIVLSLLIFASWFRLRRPAAAGYGAAAITRLVWHAEGGLWRVETASGHASDAELFGSSLVWPRLLVLNFRLKEGGKRTRLFLGDELDAESLRRLRARLLSGGEAING